MRLANRSYTQVKVEISEGLGGGSRHILFMDEKEADFLVVHGFTSKRLLTASTKRAEEREKKNVCLSKPQSWQTMHHSRESFTLSANERGNAQANEYNKISNSTQALLKSKDTLLQQAESYILHT